MLCSNRFRDILARHRRDVRCGGQLQPSVARTEQNHDKLRLPESQTDVVTSSSGKQSHASELRTPEADEAPGHTRIASSSFSQFTSDVMTEPTGANGRRNETVGSDRGGVLGSHLLQSEWPPQGLDFLPQVPGLDEQLPLWFTEPELFANSLSSGPSALDIDFLPDSNVQESAVAASMHLQNVQSLWFNNVAGLAMDSIYPMATKDLDPGAQTPPLESDKIDEQGRRAIQIRLSILHSEPSVPSVDQMNVLIRLYFCNVHPIFPLVHPATFRPTKANSSVVVAMCALGSLFTGSDQGLRQGVHLYERVHKSSLLKWERLVSHNQDSLRTMTQCACICQMLGLMSGIPSLLIAADSFWGPPIAWARYLRLHKNQPLINMDWESGQVSLDGMWRSWAHREESLRLAQGLYIIDADLAIFFHHEPIQSFQSYAFSPSSSEDMFQAPTVAGWMHNSPTVLNHSAQHPLSIDNQQLAVLAALQETPTSSTFTLYATLTALCLEVRARRSWREDHSEFDQILQRTMLSFYSRVLGDMSAAQDVFQIRILWHAVFLMFHADIDLLEKRVGREGCDVTTQENEDLTKWARSDSATRCILHGLLMVREVQKMTLLQRFAMHVQRALFYVGLVVTCFLRHRDESKTHMEATAVLMQKFPETAITQASTEMSKSTGVFAIESLHGHQGDLSLKTFLHTITDILQHSNHWQISKRFASILASFPEVELDRNT